MLFLMDLTSPQKKVINGELSKTFTKTIKQYNKIDKKKIEKNYIAKKILVYGINLDEYNKISSCETNKEIWDCLKTSHERTTQVKESNIDMLMTQYRNFITIQEMNSRFTFITKELRSLGEPILPRKQV